MSWLYVMDIVHGGTALWIKVPSWRPRADAVNKAFVIDKATCLPHIGLVVSYISTCTHGDTILVKLSGLYACACTNKEQLNSLYTTYK